MFGGLEPKGAEAVRPGLLERARQVFDGAAETTRRLLTATPVPAAAAGLRGSPHTRFHELFEVDGHEVDLAWMDDEMLVGQVVAPDGDAEFGVGGACILYGGDTPRQAALEPMGEFELATVGPGLYELAIEIPDRLLIVPELELQPS